MLTSTHDAVLDAIEQVHQLQHDVWQALLPGAEPAAVLARLKAAQEHIAALQALSTRLQQQLPAAGGAADTPSTIAAAAAAAAGGASSSSDATWTAAAQQQAAAAAAALQHEVQAALQQQHDSQHAPLLLCPSPGRSQQQQHQQQPQPAAPGTPAPEGAWLLLLQRVAAAAPNVRLHMFRDGSQYLCSAAGRAPIRHVHYCKYADEVRVVCAGVFVASVALAAPGRLQPVRVCVDAADKVSSIDPWSTPRGHVFRRINLLAVSAMQHFASLEAAAALLEAPPLPTPASAAAAAAGDAAGDAAAGVEQGGRVSTAGDGPGAAAAAAAAAPGAGAGGSSGRGMAAGLALECLLLWLACYDDLFSRPCSTSGKVVAWAPASHVPLPPIVRPYWLSPDELMEAAANPAARHAHHAHLAPWPAAAAADDGSGVAGTTAAAAVLGEPGSSDAVEPGAAAAADTDLMALDSCFGPPVTAAAAPFSDDALREQLLRVHAL